MLGLPKKAKPFHQSNSNTLDFPESGTVFGPFSYLCNKMLGQISQVSSASSVWLTWNLKSMLSNLHNLHKSMLSNLHSLENISAELLQVWPEGGADTPLIKD